MEEVAESVRDNPRTCVFAGHGVSKSFTAARAAEWFLNVYGPNATVITTAPSNDQVENILWREIAVAFNNAQHKIGGTLTKKKHDFGDKWFAYGFATTPDTVTGEATRFQGYHNDHILVIFDEAAGIMSQIWRAAEHLLTSGHVRWLAIGNPTSPYGDFADCEDDPSWNCITISVKDTPNYIEGREVIPGLSGRPYEERMRSKYGEDSNEYKIRVLGQKPSYGQGTFYGERIAQAEQNNHVRELPIHDSVPVHCFWDIGHRHTAIIFVRYIKGWLHVIDAYYDDTSGGWPAHKRMLDRKPYIYGSHWCGDDIIKGNKGTFSGDANLDIASEAGIDFNIVMQHSFMDRIAAANNIIATKCLFDSSNEGVVKVVIPMLQKYRQRKNEQLSTEDRPAYFNEPVKDWTVHPADAFGHMAIAYRFDGIAECEPAVREEFAACGGETHDTYDWNPMEGGL